MRKSNALQILYNKFKATCCSCGCQVIRVSTVQRHRALTKKVGKVVCWSMPCGDELCMPVATVEHRLPKCQGGSNSESNLELLCCECNGRRASQLNEDSRVWPRGICRDCNKELPEKRKRRRCKDCQSKYAPRRQ